MKAALATPFGMASIVLFSTSAWAQQDLPRWGDMFSEHPPAFRARYGVTDYVEERVKGQDGEFSLVQQDFSASGRVWSDDHNEVWLQGSLRFQDFDMDVILPDTGLPFPEELWAVSLGATYRYRFGRGMMVGGSVDVGSASDQPFHSSQEIVESVTAFFRMPSGERDAWLFFVAYSNNREYANSFPIPGVEYFYNPSHEFHAMVGFPMEFVEWRPAEDFVLSLSYSLIHNIHALAAYRLLDPLRVYAGFDWNTQGYLLVDRPDAKDRFFYDEKRAKAGVKLTLAEGVVLDLGGGYAFDRSYWESQHGLRSRFDRVDIDSGLYALASLEFRLGPSGRQVAERESAPEKKD